jgi:hypothetical protein
VCDGHTTPRLLEQDAQRARDEVAVLHDQNVRFIRSLRLFSPFCQGAGW